MKNKNIYFATDKNIYDALHHKRITVAILRDILLRKGIILSPELLKEDLIEEVCKLPHGFYDLDTLKEFVQTYDKRESTTNVKLTTSSSQNELKTAAEQVKKKISTSLGESVSITAKKDGSLSIEVNYQDIDLSRTALRQIDNRSIKIDMTVNDDSIDIRMPQNQKAKDILAEVQAELSKIKSEEIGKFEVSLEAIPNPELRSQFFQELMNGLEGYEVDDVTNVELNRHNSKDNDDEDEEIETGFVKKAVLKGEGVNSSAIFSQLHSKGYYIGRIAWSAKPKNGIGNRILVEVFFKDSENCSDFSYQIKGINNKKADGYNITLRTATESEKKEISELIELSAENAYNIVTGKKVNKHDES
ncbi:hypothetical protein [Pectobacterium aquaticum]|uniref:hypothetical protein n=1 Tax=Pectobacterium aquaticum TaxID=2204145 RepID=UPI000E273C50|nr:hypothetical protein [Pectobacterium aquaticum]RRN96949.1 hypothetical protein DMB83_019865 [Pectobacterium aquaticum]